MPFLTIFFSSYQQWYQQHCQNHGELHVATSLKNQLVANSYWSK